MVEGEVQHCCTESSGEWWVGLFAVSIYKGHFGQFYTLLLVKYTRGFTLCTLLIVYGVFINKFVNFQIILIVFFYIYKLKY